MPTSTPTHEQRAGVHVLVKRANEALCRTKLLGRNLIETAAVLQETERLAAEQTLIDEESASQNSSSDRIELLQQRGIARLGRGDQCVVERTV